MQIVENVRNTIKKYSMLSPGDRVLVGLSGGPDSVCLLRVLKDLGPEYGMDLMAAYIDHGLRPDEIPAEIDFCRELCKYLEMPFFVSAIDVKSYANQEKMNKQEAARELRYNALNKIALENNANLIALGHNADDQAETVMMRLFRGAGPSGLSGIPPVRGNIIRPLILTERAVIEGFLADNPLTGLPGPLPSFVVDSSNLKGEYLRNKIRHLMIPEIRKLNRDFINTISRTVDILRDEERYFEIQVAKALMKLISRKSDNTIELFISPMEAMETVILRRVLRRAIDETRGLRGAGFVHIEDIVSLVKKGASGDRIYLPHGMRAVKGYATLVITSEQPVRLGSYVLEGPGEIVLKESALVIRCDVLDSSAVKDRQLSVPGDNKRFAFFDAGKAVFPFTIRSRRQGDFFYPAGFGKRKKLQDFFVDEKVPRDERDAVPLLTFNDDIIWVMGHRADERYRPDKGADKVLRFEMKMMKI